MTLSKYVKSLFAKDKIMSACITIHSHNSIKGQNACCRMVINMLDGRLGSDAVIPKCANLELMKFSKLGTTMTISPLIVTKRAILIASRMATGRIRNASDGVILFRNGLLECASL